MLFRSRPRVDSALIGLRRVGPPAEPAVVALVREAFAHRRKSLARSLELARPGTRDAARESLAHMGLPEDARAERLAPAEFEALAAELASVDAAR